MPSQAHEVAGHANAVRIPLISFYLSAAPNARTSNQHFYGAPALDAVREITRKTGRPPVDLWAQNDGNGVAIFGGRPLGLVRLVARVTAGLTAGDVNAGLAAIAQCEGPA